MSAMMIRWDLDLELVIRIAVGTALGGVIGYERDIHGRPAGLRTHAIVALASATFMVVSSHFVYFQDYKASDLINVDASRIAASVVSGIGFLAGGAILRTGFSVQGLTTAAGLWLVAAIGLCAGAGMYVESVTATIIGVGTLTILRRFEDKDDRSIRRRLVLSLGDGAPTNAAIVDELRAAGITASIDSWSRDASARQLVVALRLRRDAGDDHLVAALDKLPGVTRIQLDSAA
jgi:putative Mg2+ transporter-C (MgtC) family protein